MYPMPCRFASRLATLAVVALILTCTSPLVSAEPTTDQKPLKLATLEDIQRSEQPAQARFTRQKIADQPFEAASACDVDGDGQKDIVSGDYWYAGPDFAKAFKLEPETPLPRMALTFL